MQKASITKCPAFFVFLLASACICTGCSSMPRQGAGAQSDILAHQEQVTRLEDRVRIYEATADRAISQLEDLRLRAAKTETTVEDVINLFDEYQRVVEQLISDYNKIRTETERQEQDP